ncbi:MAG TPA: exodeoxyribonuclease VII large subunit, partial [Herpetosiphonaceae bacterium]
EIDALQEQVANAYQTLAFLMQERLLAARQDVAEAGQRLERGSPLGRIQVQRQQIDRLLERSRQLSETRLEMQRLHLRAFAQTLRALNPEATLERGYAVVTRQSDGAVVMSPADVGAGERLSIRLRDGSLPAVAD